LFAGYEFVPEDRFQRQPIVLPDGRFFLFGGRLDNRDELVAELAIAKEKAKEMADSAIAARAWEQWGIDGLVRWIGPHASACWDPKQRELSVARGAPGGRTLMIHRRGDAIYFSTLLDALFCLPAIPREMNESVLADILMGAPRGSEFLYEGIEAVANAHWAIFRSGGRKRTEKYWSLDPGKRLTFAKEADCWATFAELFKDCTARSLRATGPVGIRLSGGLDSSAVAAQAAQILAERGEELHAYTRIPQPGAVLPKSGLMRYNDESEKVKLLAKQYPNLKVNLVPPDSGGIMDGMEDWYATNYTPWIAPPSFVSGYRPMLNKAKEDGVRLLLNGGNGNVTFSHSGIGRLRELFRSGRWFQLKKELRAYRDRQVKLKPLIRDEIVKPLTPMTIYKMRKRLRKADSRQWSWFSVINRDFAEESGALDRMIEKENLRLYFHKWTTWQRRAYFVESPGQISQGGGGEAVFGFDQRDPTSDRRLIEFCLALPEKYYLADGIDRRLARLGTKHLLPEAIRMDTRLGLQDVDWAHRAIQDRESIRSAYEKFRSDPDVSRYLDIDQIEKLWKDFEGSDWSKMNRRSAVKYQLAMLGPLHAGNFIRWFHGRND
jgi:asparagine synthase (glutamine-hydrolysing)